MSGSEDGGQRKGPNNPIGAQFGKGRSLFTRLWREESGRVAAGQERVRMFQDLAENAGVLEGFYSDDRVNTLEASGRSEFLESASLIAIGVADWAEHEWQRVQNEVRDLEDRHADVSSVSYSHMVMYTTTRALAEQEGMETGLQTLRFRPFDPDLSKPVEIRVREMLARLSRSLADQHERAWSLYREGGDASIKAAYHLHRDTFREVVQQVAPDEAIERQEWYVRLSDTHARTTHAQRMRYIRETYAKSGMAVYTTKTVEQLDKMETDLYGMGSKGAHRNVASDPEITAGEAVVFMTLYDTYMSYALEPVVKGM